MHVKESDFEEVLFQTRKNALSEACTVLVCAPPTVGALAAARIWLVTDRAPSPNSPAHRASFKPSHV